MEVYLAGAGSIVVGEEAAEGFAEAQSRSRRKSSDAVHSLGVRAASTDGACRLVDQRSIRMPHFVCLGAGGGLQVCPWPLMSKVLVVEGNDGGEKEVSSGVHRLTLSVRRTNLFRSFQKKKRKSFMKLDRYIRYVNSWYS